MKNAKRGQSIVEYVLLVVAVVLVFLVLLNPHSGLIKNSVERTLNSTVDVIDNTSREINLH